MPQLTLDQLRQLIDEAAERSVGGSTAKAATVQSFGRQLAEASNLSERADRALKEDEKKGYMVSKFVRVLARAKGIPQLAAMEAAREYGESHPVTKALAAGSATAGGYAIPPQYAQDIIEFLRVAAVIRSLDPIVLPMDVGTYVLPALVGGSSAAYIGENQNIPRTEPAFGQIVLSWKKLAALIPISNDFIRFASPAADEMVRNDLVAALAQREDLAFIRDNGTANTPKGLRYWAAAANIVGSNATVNTANIVADLNSLVLRLRRSFSRFIRPRWILPFRVEQYLRNLRSTNTELYVFPEMAANGTLLGFPYGTSGQIPENLGAGTDTEVYFADFADVIIGQSSQLLIDVSNEAAYHDGTAVVAAFSLDQTVIRAIAEHDMSVRHTGSVGVLTGVQWGSGL